MSYYKKTNDGFILRIQVVPGSSKNQIVGIYGDRLKIKIQAPPVDGKANEAVIEYLSEELNIKKSYILLIRGETSRSKDFKVSGVDIEKLKNLF